MSRSYPGGNIWVRTTKLAGKTDYVTMYGWEHGERWILCADG